MNKVTKTICTIGIGIALYVAIGAVMKIPLIAHIQTDLGYIVFGAYCVWFGWQGIIVGAAGCAMTSLLFSGMFPVGWIIGQCIIGARRSYICARCGYKASGLTPDFNRCPICSRAMLGETIDM